MNWGCVRWVHPWYFVHFLAMYLQCTSSGHHPSSPVSTWSSRPSAGAGSWSGGGGCAGRADRQGGAGGDCGPKGPDPLEGGVAGGGGGDADGSWGFPGLDGGGEEECLRTPSCLRRPVGYQHAADPKGGG